MNIDFNHYPETQIGEVVIKVPSARDCLYHDMCKMLEVEDDSALSRFIKRDDTIMSFRDEKEYDGNVVILYKRKDEEPRALFCYDMMKPISGKQFYETLCSRIKYVYVEAFI